MFSTLNRLLLCNHISQTCTRATSQFNSLCQLPTSTQLKQIQGLEHRLTKCQKSLFLPNGSHLSRDNIATAKTGMIQVGGGNLKQTILAGKTKGGIFGRNSGKDKMVRIYAYHWVLAVHSKRFMRVLKCSHQTELTPFQGCMWLLNIKVPNSPLCTAWRLPALQPFLHLDGKPTHF